MARRNRESVYDPDASLDTHDLLFGDDGDHGGDHGVDHGRPAPVRRSRSDRRRDHQARRGRRAVMVMAAVVAVIVAAAVYFIALPVYHYLNPADYDGSGTGSVVVTVKANDGASEIGRTLEDAGVVASEQAFTDAAGDDDRSQNIQPGSYRLRHHMSASAALGLLLDPASRVASDTVVREGATLQSITALLTAPRCTNSLPTAKGCGLGASQAEVLKVLKDVKNLGIPTDYLLPGGKTPMTAEGFLYPATYTFDEETGVRDALQQMVGKFTDIVRADGFSAKAKKLGLTPYRALIIASMAQAEAKYPDDMGKVVRVILNRLAAKDLLKIDATSVYAAELAGKKPSDVDFVTIDSPYNTYRNKDLPPTPIGNPGSEALDAAVDPPAGNWTYYVNGDAEGHLYFTNSPEKFVKAQLKCYENNWGCAKP
ncbi:endolytic transglycosylase MltG [Jatrophihabitans fulvus]